MKEFKSFEPPPVAISGDVSVYENVMDFTNVNDEDVHVEQVAVATWKDGKIVHERFYYNAG